MKHQVRIVSDGTSQDTVVSTVNGEVLYPRSAVIWMAAGEVNRVELEIPMPLHDVHADLQEVVFFCSCCGGTVVHHCNGDS